MNRRRFACFLKLAVVSCVLLSCLTALQTPSLATVIFDDFIQGSLSIPGPLPFGTSISFSPGGSNSGSFGGQGNAIATFAASSLPPGSVTAFVSGFASGPGLSFAGGDPVVASFGSLFNGNPTAVTFPLTFSHTRSLSSSNTSQNEYADLSASFEVVLDSNVPLFN
jgi:hypothetical protein